MAKDGAGQFTGGACAFKKDTFTLTFPTVRAILRYNLKGRNQFIILSILNQKKNLHQKL